jgi:hypothetical protein
MPLAVINENDTLLMLQSMILNKNKIKRFVSLTPVSTTNKTDHHDITDILLTVALNTRNQPI